MRKDSAVVFVIELPNAPASCWVSNAEEGDPPRTHCLPHAKRFKTRMAAEKGLEAARATMFSPSDRVLRIVEMAE